MPAVSKKQQKFFGIVRAIQKGEMAPTTPETAKAAADMKKGDVKKFASTKHKGLPEKKKIAEDRQIKKIIKQLRKSVKAHDKQADTLEKKVKTFKESNFTNITIGNKIGQTFQHVSGATVTLDNTMSNSSDQQQFVSIAGELVAAPTGNELGIAGVTMPLGKKKKKKKDENVLQINTKKSAAEINQQLDASKKASGAETAKVDQVKDAPKFDEPKPKFRFGIDDPTMPGVMTEDPEIAMNEKLYKFQKIYTDTVQKNTKIREDHERTVISPYVNKLLSPLKLKTPGTSKKLILYKERQISSEDGKIYITLETDDKKTIFKKYTLTNRGYVLSSEKSFDQPRLRSLPVMPKFLQDWQSQSVDPTGAIPRSDGAIIAEKSGVKSAFDMLNYYLDNHVKTGAGMDPSRKDIRHNLTHLITNRTKDILRKGMDELASQGKLDDGGKPAQRIQIRGNVNQYFKKDGVLGDNKLAAQLQKVDIYNSLGNDLGFDVEHYNKTGNYRFNSTYKFTSTLDMGVRVPVAGAVISLLSRKYVSGQLDGETQMAVQNPMQFQVNIESGKQYTPIKKTEPTTKQTSNTSAMNIASTKKTSERNVVIDPNLSFKKNKSKVGITTSGVSESILSFKLIQQFNEESNPRIPRKKGQPANSKKHSDLYTDENPKGTIHGLGFKNVAKAKASVSKIRNSSRSHAHKIQAAVAMEQRAREMGKTSEAAVYRKYINSMKKKTKRMNEAANPAQQAAIAISMKKKGIKPKNLKEQIKFAQMQQRIRDAKEKRREQQKKSEKLYIDTKRKGVKFYDKKGSGRLKDGKKIYD